jgi:hypothetical protein
MSSKFRKIVMVFPLLWNSLRTDDGTEVSGMSQSRKRVGGLHLVEWKGYIWSEHPNLGGGHRLVSRVFLWVGRLCLTRFVLRLLFSCRFPTIFAFVYCQFKFLFCLLLQFPMVLFCLDVRSHSSP